VSAGKGPTVPLAEVERALAGAGFRGEHLAHHVREMSAHVERWTPYASASDLAVRAAGIAHEGLNRSIERLPPGGGWLQEGNGHALGPHGGAWEAVLAAAQEVEQAVTPAGTDGRRRSLSYEAAQAVIAALITPEVARAADRTLCPGQLFEGHPEQRRVVWEALRPVIPVVISRIKPGTTWRGVHAVPETPREALRRLLAAGRPA
jgi:hypothetical protein